VKISKEGMGLIKLHEGLRLEAYPDPATLSVPWTIGYGHTKDVKPGDCITYDQADEFLLQDISWVEDCINDAVDVELTQNQFDSLCSFVFNLGCKAFMSSTLLKLINQGNFAAAQQQFARWNKAGGKVMSGLTRRRKDEADRFGV